MQPTLPQTTGAADMDLTAVESMDWFFKKEQMYLLAQFWQQRATLAEKEVNTLKEQLSTNHPNADNDSNNITIAAVVNNISNTTIDTTSNIENNTNININNNTTPTTAVTATTPPNTKLLLSPTTPTTVAATALNNNIHFNNNNTKILNSVAAAITLHQNGGSNLLATTPSPSPPLSDSGSTNLLNSQLHRLNGVNGCINPKLFFNHAQQMMMEAAAAAAAAAAAVQQQQQLQNSPMHSPQMKTPKHQQQQKLANIIDDNDVNDDKTITSMTAEMNINKADHEHENEHNDEENNVAIENLHKTVKMNEIGDKVERTDDTSIKFSNINNNNNNNNNSCSQNSKTHHHKRNCTNSIKKRNFTRNETECEAANQQRTDGIQQDMHVGDVKILSAGNLERDNNNENDNDDEDDDADDIGNKQVIAHNTNDVIDDDGVGVGEVESSRSQHQNIETSFNSNNHADLLAAKDEEIKALIEEVQRLRTLEQTHIVQIHRLEEHLEAKRQHIIRLETHLDKQQINAALTEVVQNSTARQNNDREDDEDNDLIAISDVAKRTTEIDDDEDDVAENTSEDISIKTHSKSIEAPNAAANAVSAADYKIKKENQSPLDLESISKQSAIAAAAVAAAACGNDPNKFQELLLERTKALAAAEALKNSEATMPGKTVVEVAVDVATKSEQEQNVARELSKDPTESLEKVANKIPKTEIDDDDDDNDNENGNDNENVTNSIECNKSSTTPNSQLLITAKTTTVPTVMLTNDVDDLHKSNIAEPADIAVAKTLKKNFENFSSLLGEDFVNNYWRRGFGELPPPIPGATAATTAKLPIFANTDATQQQHNNMLLPPTQMQPSQLPMHQHMHHSHHQHSTNLPNLHHHNQHQQQHGPSSTTLLSQLVNSTFANATTTNSNSSSLRTDAMQQHHHYHHHNHALHQQHQLSLAAGEHDKSSSVLHHDSSSSASTPILHDQRSNDGLHQQLTSNSLNASGKSLEDNNNSLCATPTNTAGIPAHHLPPGFLPALPFQFQERGPYRFAEDLQLPPGASMAGRLGESLIPKGDPMEAKLQEMLRYNMDKYANQALDTLHISRRVRELLSVHNIGQRLFAKYVLGLSQGTVSELLSKPKPWDKLTEKGRDSYRKMHAWGCDDTAVMLLKSLIPKKDSGLPPYGGRGEDSMPDDRIAHLLNEASSLIKNTTPNALQQIKEEQQRQMQQEQNARRSVHDDSMHSNEDSKSPHQPCTSPFYKEQIKPPDATQNTQHQQQRLRSDVSEMTPEKMARLYQEVMARAPRESAFPSAAAAGAMPPAIAAGNAFPSGMSTDESLRLAATGAGLPNFPNFSSLMALQQQVLNGAAQDLTLTKEALKEHKINGQRNILEHSNSSMDSQIACRSKTPSQAKDLNNTSSTHESERHSSAFPMHGPRKPDTPATLPPPPTSSNSGPVNTTSSAAPSPLSNSILPPAMTPGEDFSAAASPLQRMASITNSLITQPPVTPHHTQQQRPTKAVLPPITQQQFDMFNNLNTEDIVRRVKEALSQYSISQRLFGESVLGLSQGSVSDLLARPKPWHMLTQKGREPFIRMKMFLEDENAVHKLVASQYKIAPEKLMRTGSYSGSPQIPQGLANKMQAAALPMQKMMNELKLQEPAQAQHIMQQMQAAAMSAALQQQHQQQQSQQAVAAVQAAQAAAAAQHHHSMLLTSPGLPPQHAISLPAASASSNTVDKKPMMMPIHSPHQANAMRNMHQHMSPTVYEMAALTQDLDTQVITTKIKEALLANNIGQKIFGEAVLGLSQGSVSELLSKPKPWHMLSIKGREPFIRMQLWLSDANNVERLQLLKNERREASKRRRSTGPNQQDNSSDTSSNDTNDFYTSSPGPGSVGSSVSGAPPNKKQRVLFSEEQKEALRLAFTLDPYPNVGTIEFLANELGLATRTITNWFHNHRMRLKQQVPHGQPGAESAIPSRENTNSTPFDPMQFRILLQQRLFELHKERMGLSGAPIHYPPNYFAALLGRSLASLPGAATSGGGEPDLHALNQAFREQMKGLDLSMGSLKPERNDDFDDDMDGSHMSDNESMDGGDDKSTDGYKDTPRSSLSGGYLGNSRSSRRKAAAPQWLNPASTTNPIGEPNERIINGVCVLQSEGDQKATTAATTTAESVVEEANEDDVTALHGNDDSQDVEQRIMEPEVRIKQEKDEGDSDSELAANSTATESTENKEEKKIKVVGEEKLRMVRVASRLSNDDDTTAPAAQTSTAWNY